MVEKEKAVRAFLAVEVPQRVRTYVWRTIEDEQQKDMPIKWVNVENMHITLKFLGDIDEKQQADVSHAVEQITHQHEVFALNLKDIGCFPNPKYPRVLWVGVENGREALCALAREIDGQLAGLGFEPEKRFHPHLTIARMRKPCVVDHILKRRLVTDTFEATAVVLFQSTLTPHGPIYKALERCALRGVKSQH